ncbi:hypothetical protein T492DRAFT_871095, partial [Pavlovales sp. CCMP2436]
DYFAATHDARVALRRFPRKLHLERALLARLVRDDEMEELWSNAYYSFLFNLCATERVARFGWAAPGRYTIGDVVLPLMGNKVETPQHEIGMLARSYLTYDDILTHALEV